MTIVIFPRDSLAKFSAPLESRRVIFSLQNPRREILFFSHPKGEAARCSSRAPDGKAYSQQVDEEFASLLASDDTSTTIGLFGAIPPAELQSPASAVLLTVRRGITGRRPATRQKPPSPTRSLFCEGLFPAQDLRSLPIVSVPGRGFPASQRHQAFPPEPRFPSTLSCRVSYLLRLVLPSINLVAGPLAQPKHHLPPSNPSPTPAAPPPRPRLTTRLEASLELRSASFLTYEISKPASPTSPLFPARRSRCPRETSRSPLPSPWAIARARDDSHHGRPA